jgi:signal transduction histidine kinase/HAMP domain-containing protein
MRLRSHLVLFVLAALVPVIGFAVLVIRENAELQRDATERGMRATTHAVAATVDQMLETTMTTLEALTESDHLEAPNLRAFHALAERIARSHEWPTVRLFDPDGRVLIDSAEPLRPDLGRAWQPASLARVLDERRPVVSGLFEAGRHRHVVGIYAPVIHDGVIRFIVAATLPAARFSELLRAQQFEAGMVAVLQDRAGVVVARTQAEPAMVGRRMEDPPPGAEGWTRSRLREGDEVYVAYATAPRSRWRLVLTVPAETVDGPLRRALWQLLAGAAVAAALAGGLTFAFGRRIAGAVGSLVRIARALERGDPAQPLRTGVEEVNELAEQLRVAADTARAREQDAALRETHARTMADLAHAINASPDVDAVLRTAVQAARVLVNADSARIGLVDDAGRLVIRYSTAERTAMPAGFVIQRGHGLGGLALATGRAIRSDDIGADPRFRDELYVPIVRADGIVSSMAAPIVSGTAVAGVIYANNATHRPFTDDEEALLLSLADHVGVAVEKARLLAAEHAARAEAEAASRGKDELLAMLGHELRNPLSAISNAVHLLERIPPEPPVARRAVEILGRQSAHLAHLVDDLLDVARITSGRIVLTRRPLELGETVRRALATLATSGRTAQHHVTVDTHPVWVDADETRLEQVITNLVGNAVKFTPAGGTIEVGLRGSSGDAVLRIRDSGSGIEPAMLPRIFDIFVQGDRGLHGGPGGLGLGLTLVRRIVELHGGRVEAESRGRGHGSVFTVRMPALPAPPARPASPPRDRGLTAPRRVVIVEDNADAREMLRHALAAAGHEVLEAADGPEGIASIRRARPDVALVDVGLPGFDGYEVARRIRADDGGKSIRLIALTGYGQPDDRRRALEAGFDAHLVKPVDFDALDAAIRTRRPER